MIELLKTSLYRKPRAEVLRLARWGLWPYLRRGSWVRQMQHAAYTLPALPQVANPNPLELHLLSGRLFWYQTTFCLWTFAKHSGRLLRPVVYDDGTFAREYREPIERLFPSVRFVSQEEIALRLDKDMPESRFPILRERWRKYPNIRKLTDIHVGGCGWKLVIDSDLLFFRNPAFLTAWLDDSRCPLHAVDCENSYGYPRAALNDLAGAPVADLVNVGLTGLNSSTLDWDKIEHWCRQLIERHGAHYYMEQALVAMLVAGRNCAIAPATDYVTNPGQDEGRKCSAVMHHYVADSKRWYFRYCWRKGISSVAN